MENDFYNFFWQIFNVLFETNKQKFSSYKLKRITSNKKTVRRQGWVKEKKAQRKVSILCTISYKRYIDNKYTEMSNEPTKPKKKKKNEQNKNRFEYPMKCRTRTDIFSLNGVKKIRGAYQK